MELCNNEIILESDAECADLYVDGPRVAAADIGELWRRATGVTADQIRKLDEVSPTPLSACYLPMGTMVLFDSDAQSRINLERRQKRLQGMEHSVRAIEMETL